MTRFVSTGQMGKGAMRAIGVLCLLFAAGSLFYASRFRMVSVRCALVIVLPIIVAGLFVLVRTRWRTACAIVTAGATIASLIILLNCGVDKLAQRESVKNLIEAADARGYSGLPICGLHVVERSVEFYASGRLVYGPDGQPAKFEGVTQVLERARNSDGAMLVLVPIEHVPQLTGLSSARTEVIADNAVLAIVALHAQ